MSPIRSCVILWNDEENRLVERTEMWFDLEGNLMGATTAHAASPAQPQVTAAVPGRPRPSQLADDGGLQLSFPIGTWRGFPTRHEETADHWANWNRRFEER